MSWYHLEPMLDLNPDLIFMFDFWLALNIPGSDVSFILSKSQLPQRYLPYICNKQQRWNIWRPTYFLSHCLSIKSVGKKKLLLQNPGAWQNNLKNVDASLCNIFIKRLKTKKHTIPYLQYLEERDLLGSHVWG